jgi:hypothetical protein
MQVKSKKTESVSRKNITKIRRQMYIRQNCVNKTAEVVMLQLPHFHGLKSHFVFKAVLIRNFLDKK